MEPRQERVIDIVGNGEAHEIATYTTEISCKNCEYSGKAEIPKGTLVEQGSCPNCGCKTVSKPGLTPAYGVSRATESLRDMLTQQYRNSGERVRISSDERGNIRFVPNDGWHRNHGVAPAQPPMTTAVTTDERGNIRRAEPGEKSVGLASVERRERMMELASHNMLSMNTIRAALGIPPMIQAAPPEERAAAPVSGRHQQELQEMQEDINSPPPRPAF